MGMTEPGGGTDVLGMQTTAVKADGHYVLNGSKTYITNASDVRFLYLQCYPLTFLSQAEVFLVYAKVNGKITR